ncbi:MAG: tetratricopeptide repeat protein [Terriglobales bacterium]
MANETASPEAAALGWKASQVYALAVVCLVIGLAVGYLFRGSRSPAQPSPSSAQAAVPQGMPPGMGANPQGMGNQPPTLDQMKQMADKKAEPLLAQLKNDPKNADLLVHIASIYLATHQFPEAQSYFSRAVEIKPKDVPIRTSLASVLYYQGDVDGAIKQLTQATTDNPKDANSLFNLGMVRWKGKNDSKGALAAWAQLLKTNPQLEPAKKAQVEKLMAQVRQGKGNSAN